MEAELDCGSSILIGDISNDNGRRDGTDEKLQRCATPSFLSEPEIEKVSHFSMPAGKESELLYDEQIRN